MADTVATAFLGLPLDCAGCHHHPLDRWSTTDRRAFANVFARVQFAAAPQSAAAILKYRAGLEKSLPATLAGLTADFQTKRAEVLATLPWGKERDRALTQLTGNHSQEIAKARAEYQRQLGKQTLLEVFVAPASLTDLLVHPETKLPLPAQILGGPIVAGKTDAREELFRWLTAGEQPRLARVFVNRVWKHYFGQGLVEPEDIVVAANPPTHPVLLDALTRDFVANGYNLRRLEKTILLSRTYQTSAATVPGNEKDRWFFSHSRAFRLPFLVSGDLMADALGGHDGLFPGLPAGRRLIQVAAVPAVDWLLPDNADQIRNDALDRLFGRQELRSRCSQGRDWGGTGYLGPDAIVKLFQKSQRFQKLLVSTQSLETHTEELFLATLARFPRSQERQLVRGHT